MSGELGNASSTAAKIVGAVLVFATFIGCVASMVSAIFKAPTADSKMMKAPGRPGKFIARDEFEKNPAEYFRGNKKK